jgi:hypothetical protein
MIQINWIRSVKCCLQLFAFFFSLLSFVQALVSGTEDGWSQILFLPGHLREKTLKTKHIFLNYDPIHLAVTGLSSFMYCPLNQSFQQLISLA